MIDIINRATMFSFYPQPNAMSSDVVSWAATHVSRSKSLEQLVFNWLGPRRELQLESGFDEYGGRGLCVTLINGKVELGYAWIDRNYLARYYPDVRPVTEAVQSGFDAGGDAAWFEERNSRYSRRWDDYLFEIVVDRATALDCSVSYALCDRAQVNVSLGDHNLKARVLQYADNDGCLEQYEGKSFVRFHFLYAEASQDGDENTEPAMFWSESYWLIEPQLAEDEEYTQRTPAGSFDYTPSSKPPLLS